MATILLIDDSDAHRAEVGEALRDLGEPLELLEAADGLRGLKLLVSRNVDLVLCDLEMPGLDGGKLLALRNATPGGPEIPFVFLSASSDLDRRAALLGAGASDAIAKPFHRAELLARVRLHLKVKRLQEELRASNEELSRLANIDGLTGLHTRRFFDEVLERELSRARRYGTPLALALLDLDHFKRVNDEYGHVAGDAVLRGVAALLPAELRRSDLAARYGGEEFALVLPHSDASGAAEFAERVRRAIAADGFEIPDGRKVWVTASFGIAQRGAEIDAETLLERADRALYAAKRGGRDRVEVG